MCEFNKIEGSDGFFPGQVITTIGLRGTSSYTLTARVSSLACFLRNITQSSVTIISPFYNKFRIYVNEFFRLYNISVDLIQLENNIECTWSCRYIPM